MTYSQRVAVPAGGGDMPPAGALVEIGALCRATSTLGTVVREQIRGAWAAAVTQTC